MESNQDAPPLIMVVDDQWINRELMETILTGYGFRVIVAASGEDAFRLLTENRPNLILLDLRMPAMDGTEVCAHIKAEEVYQNIAVIIMTAWELSEKERRQIADAQADGIVNRIIPAPQLIETINNHLKNRV